MIMYAIITNRSVETSLKIEVIEKKAIQYAKQRKTAIITNNGKEIGWVGEDLSQRIGWGWYIKK